MYNLYVILFIYISSCSHIVYIKLHIRSCTQSTNNSNVWNTLTSKVQTKQHQWTLYPPWKDMPNDHPGLRFSKNIHLWIWGQDWRNFTKKSTTECLCCLSDMFIVNTVLFRVTLFLDQFGNIKLPSGSQNVTLTKGIQQLHLVKILAIKHITATSPISHTIYVEICRAGYNLTQCKRRPYI